MNFSSTTYLILALVITLGAAHGDTGASVREGEAGRRQLSIEEAISLALESSRTVIGARLTREEQKLSLEAAEERYRPKAGIDVSANAARGRKGRANVSVGPSLRVPTGGTFRLGWSKPVAGEGNRSSSTTLSFSQPLLKGFGPDIDTAPLRMARMSEEVNLRSFRDRIADVVTSVIGAYRGVLRAERQVAIAREALERARLQLETNRTLVRAGRMAPRDIVQTEAAVAGKEYALIDSENGLDSANSALINVLDLEEGVRVRPADEPAVESRRPDLERSLETAFARRTEYLQAEHGVERAGMELRIAENNLLWSLSLNVNASLRGGGDRNEYDGSLTLTVPLWERSPRRALARARNGVRRAEMALAETRQSIRIGVRRAVNNVERRLRQIHLARAARELAEEKLDVERRKLREGLSSSFQLGRFEDDLVRAQNREIDAAVGYRNALTSLDQYLGTTLDRWNIRVEQMAP